MVQAGEMRVRIVPEQAGGCLPLPGAASAEVVFDAGEDFRFDAGDGEGGDGAQEGAALAAAEQVAAEAGEEERRQRVAPHDLAPVDLGRNEVVDQVVGERRQAVGSVVVREDTPMAQRIAVPEDRPDRRNRRNRRRRQVVGGIVGCGRRMPALAARRVESRGPVGARRVGAIGIPSRRGDGRPAPAGRSRSRRRPR